MLRTMKETIHRIVRDKLIIKQTEIEEKFLHTTRYVEFLFVPHWLMCSLENT
jgi:hypothetical protein